jgi:hypothetical protein
MTTKTDRRVFRESFERARDKGSKMRAVIVGILPGDVLSFRLKGTRKVFTIPITYAYFHAGKLEGERVRAERKAARKARRGR